MKIEICICTFRRPSVLETLRSLEAAEIPSGTEVSVLVIDNDDTPSARDAITAEAARMRHPLRYLHVPGANISIARNGALAASAADWIAFLDDDERVDPGWLGALLARQAETGADGVFGPSRADYGPEAPAWIVAGDFHSQQVPLRGGVVETGHTCNALLRWGDAPWRQERFEIARGRAGGEDTEFFFRLRRMGARYAIAETAIVREDVPEARLRLGWLLRRRYRIGQSYAASATTPAARARLFVTAAVKASYCYLRALPAALPHAGNRAALAFWLMRGTMHLGVCAGCLSLPQARLYGAGG